MRAGSSRRAARYWLALAALLPALSACPTDNSGGGDNNDGGGGGPPDMTPVDPERPLLVVRRSGTGTGRVTGTGGLDCGSQCAITYPRGTAITLNATPDGTARFSGWSGPCAGTAPCTFTLDTTTEVTARFDPPGAMVTLTVQRSGAAGVVVSNPPGLRCGDTCTASFPPGTAVTLTSAPRPDTFLAAFGAPCATPNAACTINLTAATTVPAVFATRQCETGQACWDAPLPQGGELSQVLAFAPNNVFAVGERGTLLRYDGLSWTPQPRGQRERLFGLWGLAPNDLWIVGSRGSIQRYNGSTYASHQQDTAWDVTAIWGVSNSEIYAAAQRARYYRWNGNAWSTVFVPGPGTTNLRAVHGLDAQNAWMVGTEGNILRLTNGVFKAFASPTTLALTGVFTVAANDAWAVGERGTVLRFDGTAWKAAGPAGVTDNMTAVYATSAKDVYVLGAAGNVHRWNGSAWSVLPSNAGTPLYGIGGSAGDLWAAGGGGMLVRYDGASFKPWLPALPATLNQVWGSGDSDLWAVGPLGSAARYDGVSWRPFTTGQGVDLNDVGGSSPGDVYLVGNRGTVLHYDGAKLTSLSGIPATEDVLGVGARAGEAWFSTSKGLWYFDGANFARQNLGFDLPLNAVVATGPGQAVAGGGTLIVAQLGLPRPRFVTTTDVIVSMAGSAQNLWLGFQGGTVALFDGTNIGAARRAVSGVLVNLFATDNSDVWVASDIGELVRGNGTTFTAVSSGVLGRNAALFGTAPGTTWFGGSGGAFFRYQP